MPATRTKKGASASPVSEVYLTEYEDHLGQLKAHLSGNTGQSLPPSFIPPAGYWTSREKDCFFRALAVHSRLRPDLIADSVKSKTVLDVCAYLDALEHAAAARPMPSLRSTLDGAMEVSDAWVDYEEKQASEMAKLEPGWEEEAEEHRRAGLIASRFQEEQTYWSWKGEQESLWQKQDTLGQLGTTHLIVMARVLQKAEDAAQNAAILAGLTTEQPSEHPPPSQFHDELIDPALLALSSAEPSAGTPQLIPSKESTQPDQGPSQYVPLVSHIPPSADYLRALSPDSRRRLGKRLHMRKKRAEAKGTLPNLLPIILPNPSHVKNKKGKPRPPKSKRRNKEPEMEEEEGEGDNDEPVNPRRYYEGGLDPDQKVEQLFKNRGIDASTFTEWGVEIFNLRKLGKLMGLLDSVYADPGQETTISFDAIKTLRAILLNFISPVIQRAISMREQEVNLKRNHKPWGLQKEDQVIRANVIEALQMHGFNTHSLLTDYPEDGAADSSQVGEENNDDRLEQRFVEDGSTFHARLPLHRELAPTFVLRPDKYDDDHSLLLPDTNMDELLAEVDDDMELDKLDSQLEAQYEKNLWQAVRG